MPRTDFSDGWKRTSDGWKRTSDGWKRTNEEILLINDNDLKRRAGKFREFFEQNNEKPTSIFFRLGKEKNGDDDTTQIRDNEGKVFENQEKRKEHISKFYGDLYKRRIDRIIGIEDFLENGNQGNVDFGERKLSLAEQLNLEGRVTVGELSEALNKSNMNSACGWDGVSYWLLKKYWEYTGPLLVNCANESFDDGELCATFRTGLIKIIPKKGDAKNVEDWRPITLLCCGYKLISGIVAGRLEKYLKKNIGRGQKGFLNFKNISSCTVNIIDNISQSWAVGEKMGVLCVDFSKAFDSIEHIFIDNTLAFFNYGPVFRKMVATILRNRESRIIFGDQIGGKIEIQRGTPQGDRASPYLFILCIEILLIKIENEEGDVIKSCNFAQNIRATYNLESMLTEAYADDLTIMFKWGRVGLKRILKILQEFELVSGLKINVQKNATYDNWGRWGNNR